MTREEFNRLSYHEQIILLSRSKLWSAINDYYHIIERDALNDEVYEGMDFYMREFGWHDTMRALNRLDSNIGQSAHVYRFKFQDWYDFKAFNKGSLAMILDEFRDDDYYKELFEEEMNFEGVEALIA